MSKITPFAVTAGSITPRPYLYLPDGWDDAWKAAKANLGSTPAWITVLGDSVSTGNNSSDPMTTAWFYRLRASLLQKYPLFGDAWGGGINATDIGVANPTTPYPAVPGGGAVHFATTGFGSSYRTDPGQSWTFTTPYACTTVDFVYAQNFTGSWQYTIDGGTPVTKTNTLNNIPQRLRLTGLADTTHTILVNNASSAAASNINAFCCYNSLTSGLGFANMGQQGASSSLYLADLVRTNCAGSNTGTYANYGTLGFPSGASLWIFAYGLNDCAGATLRPAQYEYIWEQMVQLIKRANGASVLFCIPCNPRSYSDAGLAFANADNWDTFKERVYRVARNYNCAVVDIDKKWGLTSVAQGFQGVGNVHPIDAGQTDMATTIGSVL